MDRNYSTPLGITSQFSFCGLPLRLDTYAGCALSCTYCFARLRGGNANTTKVRIADPNLIINKIKNAIESPELTTGIVGELIRNRTPIHFGGMSDPFQPLEKKEKVSLSVLQFLGSLNFPVVISTKSTLLSSPMYLNALRENPNIVVQFSFSTLNDKVSKIVEPYSYAPSEILKSIEILSKYQIKTTARWQPFIPNISEQPEEFIKRIANVGIKHLGFEHLKLPLENNNLLWQKLLKNLNFDIKQFYSDNNATRDGREMVLPPDFKIKNALIVKKELNNYGITFGSADNDIQYLSDFNCCCSGVDQFEGFENWNKFQIANAIKKSNGNEIRFELIADEWHPTGSIDKYLNSESRINKLENHNTIKDYILDRWENLSSSFNPSKFYGVEYSGKRDKRGFRIFSWNTSVIKTMQ